jgi:hypothetical protein
LNFKAILIHILFTSISFLTTQLYRGGVFFGWGRGDTEKPLTHNQQKKRALEKVYFSTFPVRQLEGRLNLIQLYT